VGRVGGAGRSRPRTPVRARNAGRGQAHSGQVAEDEHGVLVGASDMTEQSRRVMLTIGKILLDPMPTSTAVGVSGQWQFIEARCWRSK